MMYMDLDYTAYPNQDWVSNWSLTPFNINPISPTAQAILVLYRQTRR